VVHADRLEHLAAQHLPERFAGHPLHDLAEEKAETEHVIGGHRADGVARARGGERTHRPVPVRRQDGVGRQASAVREAGPVLQYVTDRDRLLARPVAARPVAARPAAARLGELGPMVGDRVVEAEEPAGGEPVHEHRGQRFAGREEQERVVHPGPDRPLEDRLTVAQHAQLGGHSPPRHQPRHPLDVHGVPG
jgi:hypothetical protein